MNSLDILSFGKKHERKSDRQDSYIKPISQQFVEVQGEEHQRNNQLQLDANNNQNTIIPGNVIIKKDMRKDSANKQTKEFKASERRIPSLNETNPANHERKESSSKNEGSKTEVIAPQFNKPHLAAQTKSQKIEALKQKMGLSKQTTKAYVNQDKKKKGIIKVALENVSKWMQRKWKQCCKKKNKKGGDPKSSLRDPTKRRTGLSKDVNADKNSSGGEDGNNTSTNYSKRDSVRQSISTRNDSRVSILNNEQEKIDKEIQQLREAVKIMTKEKMYQKAYRHLIDGLLYRSVRHDLDGEETLWRKFILVTWHIQNSSLWNDFLLFLGWVYIVMSFFEPANRNDSSLDESTFKALALLESFILFLQTMDLFMEIIQRSSQEFQNILQAFISRKKNFFRLLFFLLNTSDLIIYVTSYPDNSFRFARVFRPLQIIIFSKSLRRNFQGIINSAKNLLMILFFDIIITSFWAYLGVNMIGDLYNDDGVDTFAVDFRDFFKAANVLYIFSSLEVYPDILFPAITNSFYYLFYFLPYLIMFLLLFAPIPVAVVYEGFRKHRLNLLIADRIKRRKALWACFQCIVSDTKKSYIGKPDFCAFFNFVYKKVELDEAAEILSDVLWNELDANDNKKVSIEEFFTVIDFTEQRKEFRLQRIKPRRWWEDFREYSQNKFDLNGMLNGNKWEAVSFLMTIGSCVITIIGLVDEEASSHPASDFFDKLFFAFFVLEIMVKLVAQGITGFFDESWNVFDLTLVLFQAFFDYIFFSFMKGSNVKSVSASRVLKIAKLQKVFRMFRAFRTVKVLNYILSGLDIIQRVYEMLYKIVICIPIVMKLSVICVIVLYIYAAIGVELFSTQLRQIYPSEFGQQQCDKTDPSQTDFNSCQYANFNTFGGAILVLLQVCVGSGWGNILFDYGKKFNDLTMSAVYFNSFHFLSVFVLSLIGGLVWEVFDVVERIMRDQQAIDQQMELQRQWEEQQQQIEASFQSSDQIKKPAAQQSQYAKRNSVRHSLKAASAFMKIPLTQKYTVKPPSYQDNQDEDEDVFDQGEQGQENEFTKSPTLNLNLEEKSISKIKSISNKQEFQTDHNDDNDESDYEIGTSQEEDDSSDDEQDDEENDIDDEERPLDENANSVDQENNNDEASQKSKNNEIQSDNIIQNNRFLSDELVGGDKQKNILFFTKSDGVSQQSEQGSVNNNESKNNINSEKKLISNLQFGKSSSSQSKMSMKKQNIKSSSDDKNIFQRAIEKSKRIKRKRNQKKNKVNSEFAQIYRQSCFIDNQVMTQRDRSELILYQDIFKLSTLDQFYKNTTFKSNFQMPNEVVSPDVTTTNLEGTASQTQQGQQGLTIPAKKMSKFHTIKEEEEEENDNPSTLVNIQQQQNHILQLQARSASIAMKLIGVEEISNPDLDENQQTEQNQSKQAQTTTEEKKPMVLNEKQIIAKKLSSMSSKQFNSISDSQGIIKEEEGEEENKGSFQEPKNSTNQGGGSQGILSERRCKSTGKRDDNQETKYFQIQNTPIKNPNVIRQSINFHTKHLSLDKQLSGGSRDSESYKTIQIVKFPSSNSTSNQQESVYKSFSQQQESFQQNGQFDNSMKRNTNSFKSHQNLNNGGSQNQFKQRYSDQYVGKQQYQSRHSSFGGLIIVDASQSTSKQNTPICSSSSLSNSSLSSSPTIIKQLEKNENLKKNSSKKDQLFEYLEQADSPQLRNQFPERQYLPSKKTREEHEFLTETHLRVVELSKDMLSKKSQSEKKDDERKSIFSQPNEDQKKISQYPTPSTSDLNNNKEKQFSQSYIQYSQPDDIIPLQNHSVQHNASTHFELNHHKIDLDKAEKDFYLNDQSNNKRYNQQKNISKSKQLVVQDETPVERRKVSTIVEQSSNFEQDFITNPFNNEEDEVIQTKQQSNENDYHFNNETKRSRSQTGGNVDGSDCAFINNTFDEQHNIILSQPQLLMGSSRTKDLNYNNFKKDIEAQKSSPSIDGDNEMNQLDLNKEDLEASFLEEMSNMQNKVFYTEKDEEKKKQKQIKLQKRKHQLEQCRQDLFLYYKNNLTDINAMVDQASYQYMNFNPLVSNQIGSKQKQQNVDNKAQRDIIQDKPKNTLMKNHLLNINQDLRNEQSVQMKIDLNNKNFIINKAILKSVDQNKIQKIELRHFRQLYGKQFEDMLDNDIFPLWHQQAKMLFHFDNILKQLDFFFLIIFFSFNSIFEMSIESYFKKYYSFCQKQILFLVIMVALCIFISKQITKNIFYSINIKLIFEKIKHNRYDFIPIEQFVQIYCSLEMQISSLLMNKFSSFKIIYQDTDDKWFTINFVQEAFFLQEVENMGPWKHFDALFDNTNKSKIYKHRNIFSYNEKNEYIKKKLKKYFNVSQDLSNNYYFRRLQVNQKRSDVVYIPFTNDNPEQTSKNLLEILTKTPSLPEYIKKDDLTLEMLPRVKRGLAIAYLFDNPNIKQRKRQFNSEKINIEQAIVEEDILEKEQLNNTHNYSYSIELLKDMQKHILMNKDMLFKKISQFYFYRSCFERNFCSIMEIPFEQ